MLIIDNELQIANFYEKYELVCSQFSKMKHNLIIILAALCLTSASSAENSCTQSETTAKGTKAPAGPFCSGDLIFEENFNELDTSLWKHEITMGGGGNWEFQVYK